MNTVILQQPKRVMFGPGCAQRAVDEFAAAGRKRIYVVSSPTAARHSAALIETWRANGAVVEVSIMVNREPEVALFEAVLAGARAFGPDAVVGLGGGSPLDVAKLVAALADGRQAVREVFGIGNLRGRAVYLACVPTTAGTGSEVSPNSVLIDETEKVKKGVISPHLVPDAAFLDPVLTVPVPPGVTAAVGIDALVHCMEGYANKAAHPAVDVYALEGIRRIGRSIAAAVARGDDLAARTDVMLGALYGGLCLGPVNTAAVHALSAPLGGEYRIAHGVANSLLMPHVFRFNLPAMPERYADIAVALGVAVAGSPLATAETGLRRLVELSRACGVPQRLRDVAIPEADLPRLALEAAKIQRLLKNNPREVTAADALEIYRAAW
ncbi:MAG: iron-containing alcohol dehydrogenase [Opitutus sp.]|nr:iron-containing alcohol dehydrogenase [Opitutus sp.]